MITFKEYLAMKSINGRHLEGQEMADKFMEYIDCCVKDLEKRTVKLERDAINRAMSYEEYGR